MKQLIMSKHSGDVNSILMFVRVTLAYTEMLKNNAVIEAEAKYEINLLYNSLTKFINWCKKIGEETNPDVWEVMQENRDYLSYAAIYYKLMLMDDDKISIVEKFCEELAEGRVRVEYENELENA
jgi:hypothetical protein